MIGRRRIWAAALCLAAGPAQSHPHVFADTRIGFVLDETGAVTALQVRWHYDAFTSLTLWDILDLDPERDGVLDAADFARIAAGETDWPEGYTGDLHVGDGPALARPTEALAGETDDRIWVSFTVPFAAPRVADGLTVEIYDPSYYYAYDILSASVDSASGCRAAVTGVDGGEEMRLKLAALSREEMPDDPNVGAAFAQIVTLTCK